MLVLIVEPKKIPYTREISDTLKSKQSIVGGTIQVVYPFNEEVALVCNDEGKFLGLPANRGLRGENGTLYDIVCGTFFLCGAPADSERFTSLTPEQVERYQQRFHTPELFLNVDGQILCLPVEENS